MTLIRAHALTVILTTAFVLSMLGSRADASERRKYELRLHVLESEVSMACSSPKPGETRALLASLAYRRAKELTQEVNAKIVAVHEFLRNPEQGNSEFAGFSDKAYAEVALQRLTALRVRLALMDMEDLTRVGNRIDLASARARGCFSGAVPPPLPGETDIPAKPIQMINRSPEFSTSPTPAQATPSDSPPAEVASATPNSNNPGNAGQSGTGAGGAF